MGSFVFRVVGTPHEVVHYRSPPTYHYIYIYIYYYMYMAHLWLHVDLQGHSILVHWRAPDPSLQRDTGSRYGVGLQVGRNLIAALLRSPII